jgi:O-methyltransferase involved in polyketide biosynthesis
VWHKHGLAPPEMVPRSATVFHHGAYLLEFLFKRLMGLDLQAFLLQRHLMLDHLLEKEIEEHSDTTVVEIGCGYSPRGVRFMDRHGSHGVKYVELDLPEVARQKLQLVERLNREHRPVVVPCNLLEEMGPLSLEDVCREHVPRGRHLVLITEGLVNYFDPEKLSRVWKRMADILDRYPSGAYLTDITLRNFSHPRIGAIRLAVRAIAAVARSKVFLHGDDEADIREQLCRSGFRRALVCHPSEFRDLLPEVAREEFPVVRVAKGEHLTSRAPPGPSSPFPGAG